MAKKSKDSLFSIPKKGARCVRYTKNFAGTGKTTQEQFHKNSFRWVHPRDAGKGPAYVMVGCPKKTRPRKKGSSKIGEKSTVRLRETVWNPSAPLGIQCRYKDGQPAGLRGHKVIQPRVNGKCRKGYALE